MRSRAIIAAAAIAAMLAAAPPAAAKAGEGWAGELNDKVITFFSLGVVVFFVLVVFIGTVVQTRLERRKEAEKAAKLRQRVGW